MATAEALIDAVRTAEAAEDPDATDAARQALIDGAPNCPQATDARYRLGLSRLFRLQDREAAMALFKEAAKDKESEMAKEARISLALCLHGMKKRQQAIFELRKLLPAKVEPSVHTATALDFLTLLLREAQPPEGSPGHKDLTKTEETRRAHLEALSAGSDDPVEKAHWQLRLAAAYADSGSRRDLEKARTTLSNVVKMGKAAGESALTAARDALKTLPR